MSRHAVRATVAGVALNLAVLSPPVWAQDTPSAVRELDELRARAAAGEAEAQTNLAFKYANGEGVPEDDAEASRWFRLAADQGHPDAQIGLGWRYVNGEGVQQDDAEAIVWFRLAAEQGFDSAQFSLGWMYQWGRGVAQDHAEAAAWYRKAAEQGLAIAQHDLGHMYAGALGVPQDAAEAARWWRLAAEQGLADAQFSLGFRAVLARMGRAAGRGRSCRAGTAWPRSKATLPGNTSSGSCTTPTGCGGRCHRGRALVPA